MTSPRCVEPSAAGATSKRGDQTEQHLARDVLAHGSARAVDGQADVAHDHERDDRGSDDRRVGVPVDQRRAASPRPPTPPTRRAPPRAGSRARTSRPSRAANGRSTALVLRRRDHTDVPREPEHVEQHRTRELGRDASPDRLTPRDRAEHPRVDGQRGVERQLDRERPRRARSPPARTSVGRSARAGSGARSPRTRAAPSCGSSRIVAVSATQYAG